MSATAWKLALRRALFGTSRPTQRRVRPHLLTLEDRAVPAASLLTDINAVGDSIGTAPRELTDVNGTLFFTQFTPTAGRELWKTDGTAAGTVLVKDITPGGGDPYYGGPSELTNVGGVLYFVADDGVYGRELWKSDGTAAGTVMVADINYFGSSEPTSITGFAGKIYFTANDGYYGREIWESDGTSGGTTMLADINPDSYSYYAPEELTVSGSRLFFAATDHAYGYPADVELWAFDGTAVARVRDINPGAVSSEPRELTDVNGTLFFAASDGVNGTELWKSDGSLVGTVIVEDIYPVLDYGSYPSELTAIGSRLFFTAGDGSGVELWKSDGTAATTDLVRNVDPTGTYAPTGLTAVGGVLFFSHNDSVNGYELWKSDGTAGGTVLVRNINSIATYSSFPQYITDVGGVAYFVAADGVNGQALWKSNGTSGGTVLVKDIDPFDYASYPISGLAASGGNLFFVGFETDVGENLWISDGTTAGTETVLPPFDTTLDANPEGFTEFNGFVYFRADDGVTGSELWRTDGTAAGTEQVADIYTGYYGSNPADLTVFGGFLYFTADDGVAGRELWRTDGTTTTLVSDIETGYLGSSPVELTVVGSTLYFTASTTAAGRELWKTDGTTTALVEDINPGANGSSPSYLSPLGGVLYFSAVQPATGRELWRSGGTAATTDIVEDTYPGTGSSYPQNLAAIGGTLYFLASDGTNGYEPWTSDGTAAGTAMLANIDAGAYNSNPAYFTEFNGLVYFAANDEAEGTRLWRTDGTTVGTVPFFDANPTAGSGSYPYDLVISGGKLFFSATDAAYERQLWATDGTLAGTLVLTTLPPAAYYSVPITNLTDVDGTLFFTAENGVNGRELWRSDGTAAGTVLDTDIAPGIAGSNPDYLTFALGQLYFSAVTDATGREVWLAEAGPTSPTVTINQAAGQADPVATGPILFTVTFSEAVTGFAANDISFAGSSVGGTLVAAISGSGATYTVSVTGMTGEGTVVASVLANAATGTVSGITSAASTSSDNSVLFAVAPAVTINQASGQADPAIAGPIEFTVVFSEPVTGFATGDVSFAGSTVGGALIGTVSGSGTTYTVSVTGMTTGGNVVVSIPVGVAQDADGNPNGASTSTDNTVAFNTAGFVGIDAATYTAVETDEGGLAITITVSRIGNVGPAGVDYAFTAGSAEAGDFTVAPGLTGTLSWLNGEDGPRSLTFTANADTLNEWRETVALTLSNPTGGAAISRATATVTIAESDGVDVAAGPLTDPGDGDAVTFKVAKGGTATAYLTDGAFPIGGVVLTGTDPLKSVLSMKVKKGSKTTDGVVDIGAVTGTAVKAVNLSKARLNGDGIDLPGPVQLIKLNAILNGADIDADGSTPKKKTKIIVTGDVTGSAVDRVVISLDGPVSLFKAGGTVSFTDLFVGGSTGAAVSVGTVSVGDFLSSRVYAGYGGDDFGEVPTAANFNTASPATIGTFKTVKSTKLGAAGTFADSYVVASTIKKTTIVSLDSDPMGDPFGIYADTAFTTVTVKAPVKQVFKKNVGGSIENFNVVVV